MRILNAIAPLILTLTLIASPLAMAKTYRWVDENGKTHYGDRIPPQYSKQERHELDDKGYTTRVLERQKTADELAREKRIAEEKAVAEKRKQTELEYDRKLIEAYADEQSIIEARDFRTASLDNITSITGETIKQIKDNLARQEEIASRFVKQDKPIPKNVQKNIRNSKLELAAHEKFLLARQKERADIIVEYNKKITRYRKLKGIPTQPVSNETQTTSKQ